MRLCDKAGVHGGVRVYMRECTGRQVGTLVQHAHWCCMPLRYARSHCPALPHLAVQLLNALRGLPKALLSLLGPVSLCACQAGLLRPDKNILQEHAFETCAPGVLKRT